MRCYSILLSNFLICLLFIIGLLQSIPGGRCSGTFELQILEIENLRGEVSGGECCGGAQRMRLTRAEMEDPSPCIIPCRTFFKVCLKEYQNNMSAVSGSCSYGNTSSPVLGGNSFTLADPDRANGKLVIRFKFSWTRAFTLLLEALDFNNHTASGTGRLIEKATYSGIILPSSDWHTLNHHGMTAKITYRIRVQCDKHYFNSTCMKFCRPRDDKFGHFTCDPNGDKECIAGWKGVNCEIAVCKTGCHTDHAKCDHPGGCECRPGWRGEFCDQCQPYPGCKHGFCHKPYECICNTNWGGMLCDKDLNYCGTHEPCLNGGTCSNTAPDQYMCACPEGLSGSKCEVVINPCVTGPCSNGGTCVENLENHYQCICPPGWTGNDCTINIDECSSSPCQNGGTCVDDINGYQCLCSPSWEGDHCQNDINECDAKKPCKNANSCQNLPGDYQCDCLKGWDGKNCDHNINDCVGQCQHGSTCIDLVNDYYCACTPGYTGKDCQTDINECESNPCKNGGECVNEINAFRCICPVGYAGEFCQIDHDHCSPNPCANNAQCLNMPEDYYCHCTETWQGKNCSIPKPQCTMPPCDSVDNCLILPAVVSLNESETTLPIFATGMCGEHGRCVSHADGSYRCSCDLGYTGKFCHESEPKPCAEGFEGEKCQYSTNDNCSPNPCLNGGKCINGKNWFLCECTAGFTGPECRININECSSNPCTLGSTCVDGIASYKCICPPGRKGSKCELMEDLPYLKGICLWEGQYFANNSNWQHKCNTCGCLDSQVRCSNVWCGFGNCLSPKVNGCEKSNQVCVPITKMNCLSLPCYAWGECRDLLSGNKVSLSSIPAPPTCQPNQAILSDYCMRMSLYVDTAKLRPSVTTEDLCNEIRGLVSVHEATRSTQFEIIVLCDFKLGLNDTVEITLSCSESADSSNALKDHVKFIGEIISRKQVPSLSILNSVMEIKLETVLIPETKQAYTGSNFIIFHIAIAAISICAIVVIVYCYRCTAYKVKLSTHSCDMRSCEEEKSNNIQNEENFRRYANPLKEDLGCNLSPSAADLPTRISVVRPIARATSREMMEMISEADTTKGVSSKALLSKTQNSDFQKHSLHECGPSKEVPPAKPLNINVVPFVQRTMPQNCDNSVLV